MCRLFTVHEAFDVGLEGPRLKTSKRPESEAPEAQFPLVQLKQFRVLGFRV